MDAVETIEPLPIKRLDEALVNRIAAGEIIQRPSSALKELLENCLDAGSTSIKITVKDGGLKLLQIQDDGSGIRKSDLPILCHRFTTSKLTQFSDLASIATYGFRGEALASISYTSHLTVVTKTRQDACAWRVVYADGNPISPKPGVSADPKPCAGNDGTVITVEDLFFNTPIRLAALKNTSDQYARILDVVSRYAVHNPTVAFSCKKAGSPSPDITTPPGSTVLSQIRLLHGPTVAKELVHVTMSSDTDVDEDAKMLMDEDVKWDAEAYISNLNHRSKKMTFLLFINHRMVDSSRLKRAIEAAYNMLLPKGTHPFIYLSLNIDPASVDVNVHPTKREVHFLNEDKIIESVVDQMQAKLATQNHSRTYEYQTQLTGITSIASGGKEERDRGSKYRESKQSETEDGVQNPPKPKVVYAHHKVRGATQNDRTLDAFMPATNSSQRRSRHSSSNAVPKVLFSSDDVIDVDDGEVEIASAEATTEEPRIIKPLKPFRLVESQCSLDSVLELREDIHSQRHSILSETLGNMTFVGIVDLPRSLSLIQHSTKLFIINHHLLGEELFYQLGARQFGSFARLRLEPPPSLKVMIRLAVDCDVGVQEADLDVDLITNKIVGLVTGQKNMLDEYFSLRINDDLEIETLPKLLPNFTPNMDELPRFLMRLGPQVNWTSEKECFQTFLRELAIFYASPPTASVNTHTSSLGTDVFADPPELSHERQAYEEKAVRWQIEHALIPAIRSHLVPPRSLISTVSSGPGSAVTQVANLPDLYRVFERC